MRIYQDEGVWRIGHRGERLAQVFKTRKDAQRWMAKRRAVREAQKKFWEGVPSIGEILDRQYLCARCGHAESEHPVRGCSAFAREERK